MADAARSEGSVDSCSCRRLANGLTWRLCVDDCPLRLRLRRDVGPRTVFANGERSCLAGISRRWAAVRCWKVSSLIMSPGVTTQAGWRKLTLPGTHAHLARTTRDATEHVCEGSIGLHLLFSRCRERHTVNLVKQPCACWHTSAGTALACERSTYCEPAFAQADITASIPCQEQATRFGRNVTITSSCAHLNITSRENN